jgi:hypothetical protein
MKRMMSVKKIGNLFGATGGSFAGNIYDRRGLCPTINCAGGGWREPMIIEEYEGSDKVSSRVVSGRDMGERVRPDGDDIGVGA